MYIIYNDRDKEFRLYLEGDYDWIELINKYKKHNKSIWIWNDTENCFCSKAKTAIGRSYYDFCIESIKYKLKDIYEKNIIYRKKYDKNRWMNNSEKEKKRNKKYYISNIQKIKERDKKYYENNFERIIKYKKEKRKSNVARYLLSISKMRERNNLTIEDIGQKLEEIRENDGYYYCPIFSMRLNVNKDKTCDNSFSLDRIDNNKKYTSNNIAIISHKANRIKGELTLELAYKLKEYLELGLKKQLPKQENYYIIDSKERMKRYNRLKNHAKNRRGKKIEFSLCIDDIIFPKIDFFGFPISFAKDCPRNERLSCDRINTKLGYIKNNIYWISVRANTIKGSLTLDVLEKIIDYMERKK